MSRSTPVKSALGGGVSRTQSEGDGNTIRVVSARTGLGMETLRAWERRYGFPRPERRPGSNRRLYSAADIARLVAIVGATERGYRVGDVVGKTLREIEDLCALPPSRADLLEPSEPNVAELVTLLERDDVVALEAKLRRAALGLGPRRFITDLAHPFVVSVGEEWAAGRLSVRHEHLATECLVTQVRHMLSSYQDVQARPLVLLATLPGEPHTLPLQMVALYLVALGAKPRLLGGDSPVQDIIDSARALHADVVGLTVTPTSDRKKTRAAVELLRAGLPTSVALWLGGAGATAVGFDDEKTEIVTSWAAIEEAVAHCRKRPKPKMLAR